MLNWSETLGFEKGIGISVETDMFAVSEKIADQTKFSARVKFTFLLKIWHRRKKNDEKSCDHFIIHIIIIMMNIILFDCNPHADAYVHTHIHNKFQSDRIGSKLTDKLN